MHKVSLSIVQKWRVLISRLDRCREQCPCRFRILHVWRFVTPSTHILVERARVSFRVCSALSAFQVCVGHFRVPSSNIFFKLLLQLNDHCSIFSQDDHISNVQYKVYPGLVISSFHVQAWVGAYPMFQMFQLNFSYHICGAYFRL